MQASAGPGVRGALEKEGETLDQKGRALQNDLLPKMKKSAMVGSLELFKHK